MSWREYITDTPTELRLPWFGQSKLCRGNRSWRLKGALPIEFGWYLFREVGRNVFVSAPTDRDDSYGLEHPTLTGYLAGDRFITDPLRENVPLEQFPKVFLLDPDLGMFSRIKVAQDRESNLVYIGQEFPSGPESEVLQAFEDRQTSVNHIKHVTPALTKCFEWESRQRFLREEHTRKLLEAQRKAEEEARKAALREEAMKNIGTALGRRALAEHDFVGAATAALALTGATYLTSRSCGTHMQEVRFRYMGQRFEVVVDSRTLQILDAGICLQDHDTYEKGDRMLSLESFPSVLKEAIEENKLVVWRHV